MQLRIGLLNHVPVARCCDNRFCLQGDNLVCDNGICAEAPAAVSPSPTPVSPAPASPAPTPGAACGDLDWPCCAPDGPEGGECPKGDNLKCMDGVCRVAACGDPGWPCCAPDGPEGGECPKVRTITCANKSSSFAR